MPLCGADGIDWGSDVAVRQPDYTIEFVGRWQSSKDDLIPRKDKAGRGLMLKPSTRQAIDRMALECIGPDVRGLYLISPDVEVEYYCADGSRDKNNAWTTVLDMMVQAGVLWNDSTASFNGTEIHYPAVFDGTWRIIVKLYDSGVRATRHMIEERMKSRIKTTARRKQRKSTSKTGENSDGSK